MVYSNGIRAKGMHGGGIELALGGVDQGIVFGQLVCDTCNSVSSMSSKWGGELGTFNIVLCSIAIEEFCSHGFNGGD